MSRPVVSTCFALFLLSPLVVPAESAKDKEGKALVENAERAMELRQDSSTPFQLSARIQLSSEETEEGSYHLLWESRQKWREQIDLPSYQQTAVRNEAGLWLRRSSLYPPERVQQLLHLLRSESSQSVRAAVLSSVANSARQINGDHSSTCIEFSGRYPNGPASPRSVVCIDDESKLIQSRTEMTRLVRKELFSDYAPFERKQYPRTQRFLVDEKKVVEVFVDSLKGGNSDPTLFDGLSDTKPQPTCSWGEAAPPKVTQGLDPEYPDDARRRNIQGAVVLHTLVGTDGKAHDPIVLHGVTDSLNWEAIETVKRWRFDPAKCGSLPIGSEIDIEVDFRLDPR